MPEIIQTPSKPNIFRVESLHEPNKWYTVDAQAWTCSCEGYYHRHECTHVKLIQRFIEEHNIVIPEKKKVPYYFR